MIEEIRNRRGRPLKGSVKRLRTSFTLPPEQVEWLKKEARLLKLTKSEKLSHLISQAQYYKTDISSLLRTRFQISEKILKRLCERHHIKRLSLFGSILTGKFGPESDIDILVEFEKSFEPTLFTLARLEEELTQFLGSRKIDIKTPEDLSRYFRKEVMQESEMLYAA